MNTNMNDSEEAELVDAEIDLDELVQELTDSQSWGPADLKFFSDKTRSLLLVDEINSTSSSILISQLLELDSINTEPIKLFINSPGGSINDGLAIYDIIRRLNSPVIGIAIGQCASAAVFILAGCDSSISYEHTSFMIHEPVVQELAIHTEASATEFAKLYKNYKLVTERIMLERSNLNEKDWQVFFGNNTDTYLTAEEMKEIGLVDLILRPRQKEQTQFVIDKTHFLYTDELDQ